MNKTQKDNLFKEINKSINCIFIILYVFLLGLIFSLANYFITILIPNLSGKMLVSAFLFYVFSVVVAGYWVYFNKILEGKE